MPQLIEMPSREKDAITRSEGDCLVHSRRESMTWPVHAIRRHTSLWREINKPSALPQAGNPTQRNSSEVMFENLADQWETETALESIVARKAMHPAYQRIIGMGSSVVPLILRRLQREPRQWFWALTAITGDDPAAGHTTVEGASAAWLQWGRERGLVGD
jgi:hypothetical protein